MAQVCLLFNYICNSAGKHLKTLWHLYPYRGCIVLSNMMNSLVYLEGVIRRQLPDGCIEVLVVQNIVRYLISECRMGPGLMRIQ